MIFIWNMYFLVVGLLSTLVCAQSHGEEESEEMGPVAFMWPPDRAWAAEVDNNPPCGSRGDVTNRTEFPLSNGQVALVIQDESWDVQVGISLESSPTSNDDFEPIVKESGIPELDTGHQCYPVSTSTVTPEEGQNATLQIKYWANFDSDEDEVFYACADITFIPNSEFTYQVPCFNATSEEFGPLGDPTATPSADSDDDSDGGSGLSGGAIAGIVVGAVAGLALIVALLFFYRRLLQKYRAMRHKASIRNADLGKAPDGTNSNQEEYDMQNMR